MAILKRREIPGGELQLKQLKNDLSVNDNPYKYVVEFPDGDRTQAVFTRKEGEREFRRVFNLRSRDSNFGVSDMLGF